jgi:predicted RNase H-like nuclease
MAVLVVGFDSAWAAGNAGAIVGAVRDDDGSLRGLGRPTVADFAEASKRIVGWQTREAPAATVAMIDQPTVEGRGQVCTLNT